MIKTSKIYFQVLLHLPLKEAHQARVAGAQTLQSRQPCGPESASPRGYQTLKTSVKPGCSCRFWESGGGGPPEVLGHTLGKLSQMLLQSIPSLSQTL